MITAFICQHPGLTTGNVKLEEVNNAHGQHYWKATEPIGTIFGEEVEGELSAMGSTKEIALANLAKEKQEMYDSLWV